MFKNSRSFLVLVGFMLLVAACGSSDTSQKYQGTWKLTKVTVDGTVNTSSGLEGTKLVITGSTVQSYDPKGNRQTPDDKLTNDKIVSSDGQYNLALQLVSDTKLKGTMSQSGHTVVLDFDKQ